MAFSPTQIELAFKMAESGEFSSVGQIRDALRREYVDDGTTRGSTITKQLTKIIALAKARRSFEG